MVSISTLSHSRTQRRKMRKNERDARRGKEKLSKLRYFTTRVQQQQSNYNNRNRVQQSRSRQSNNTTSSTDLMTVSLWWVSVPSTIILSSAHTTNQARWVALVGRPWRAISALGVIHAIIVVLGREERILDLPHRLLRADRELEVFLGDTVPVFVDHHHGKKHAKRVEE